MKKILCADCAKKAADVYIVRPMPVMARRVTCSVCGRKRFGVEYEILPKRVIRSNRHD